MLWKLSDKEWIFKDENSDISFDCWYICPICIDLPCCGHSRSPICRETCKNILEIGETMQQIIDTLTPGCGPVSILFRFLIGAELTKKNFTIVSLYPTSLCGNVFCLEIIIRRIHQTMERLFHKSAKLESIRRSFTAAIRPYRPNVVVFALKRIRMAGLKRVMNSTTIVIPIWTKFHYASA